MAMLLAQALGIQPDEGRPEVVAFTGAGGKSSALFRLTTELQAAGRRVVTTTTTRMAETQIRQAPAVVSAPAGELPEEALRRALDAHGQVLLIGRETIEQGPVHKRAGVAPHVVDRLAACAADLGLGAILVEADGSHMLPAKAPAEHEPVVPASTTLLVPVLGLDSVGQPLAAGRLHRPEIMRRLLNLPDDDSARLTPEQAARLLLHPAGGDKGRVQGTRRIFLLNKADTSPRRAVGRLMADALTASGAESMLTHLQTEGDYPVNSRHGPVAAVILAAGESARMGRPKQLLTLAGVPLVVRAVETALAGGADWVAVVLGAYQAEVTAALADYGLLHTERVDIVHNPRWPSGQASSVAAGLAHIVRRGSPSGSSPDLPLTESAGEFPWEFTRMEGTTRAAVFLPVDQPFAPAWLLRGLIRLWEGGAGLAAPRANGELRGAPALFDRAYWPELIKLTGDVGGRGLLRRHADLVASITLDAERLRDWDCPDDVVVL
ncbi:MAG: putative selenium-dependent hydroxylase accessory protein YqeC [Caldilineaceae bacterium]|nr:putative selenium-dependent hydroxylase accessory protein YqeC [Caldilineaceae bacterium]